MKELSSITSTPLSANQLKKIRCLRQKKYRIREGLFIAEGVRLCEEALNSVVQIDAIILSSEQTAGERIQIILQHALSKNIPIYHVSEKIFFSISETETPQGIACLMQQPTWDLNAITTRKQSLLLGLDAIQDPGNLGTILRTAEWFGVDGILLGKGCVDLYNAKVVRSSMGAIFYIPTFENISLEEYLPELKKRAYRIIGTKAEQRNNTPGDRKYDKSIILMGNEANGLTANISRHIDEWITIFGKGKSESLNVAIATGIVLYLILNPEKANERLGK